MMDLITKNFGIYVGKDFIERGEGWSGFSLTDLGDSWEVCLLGYVAVIDKKT